MVGTNYIGSIVKILEKPNQTLFNNTIPITRFRVQFPQFRNSQIITLIFWGNLARDVAKYYNVNDYILIEGYLSLKKKHHLNIVGKKSKKVEITVLKVYPFLLTQNRQINKK
jgi:single-stranded DNA-binding protein